MTKWDDLEKLAALKKKGVITDAEFEEQKKALLSCDEDVSAGDDISPFGRYIGCFKKYATFQGRANRAEYWWFFLFNLLASIVLSIASFMLSIVSFEIPFVSLGTAYSIISLFPNMAVSVRRMHDTNHSGWWYFFPMICTVAFLPVLVMSVFLLDDPSANEDQVMMIPFFVGGGAVVFWIIYFIFTLLPGTKGENRYGKVPV